MREADTDKMAPVAELIGRTEIMRDVLRRHSRDDLAATCDRAIAASLDLAHALLGIT